MQSPAEGLGCSGKELCLANEGWQSCGAAPAPLYSARKFKIQPHLHSPSTLPHFPTSLGTQVSPQGGFVVPNLAINVPGCAGARGCAGWDGHIAAEIPKQKEVFSPAKNKLGRFNFASIPRV